MEEVKEIEEICDKSINEYHKELQETIQALNQDFIKFNQKKFKIAGARVRNNLLNCKKLCDKLRRQIQNEVKALPTKHRIKGDSEDDEVKTDEVKEVKEVEEVKEEKEEKKEKTKRVRKANIPK